MGIIHNNGLIGLGKSKRWYTAVLACLFSSNHFFSKASAHIKSPPYIWGFIMSKSTVKRLWYLTALCTLCMTIYSHSDSTVPQLYLPGMLVPMETEHAPVIHNVETEVVIQGDAEPPVLYDRHDVEWQEETDARTAHSRSYTEWLFTWLTDGSRHDYARDNYIELGSGLNHGNSKEGWIPSETSPTLDPETGEVRYDKLASPLTFSPNVNRHAVLTRTLESMDVSAAVAALSYYDNKTGVSAIIGDIQDAQVHVYEGGVYYPNCFAQIEADIVYKVHPWGVEQDVVFWEQLPDPAEFGLNPETTILCVLTEFSDYTLDDMGITRPEGIPVSEPDDGFLEIAVQTDGEWERAFNFQRGYAYSDIETYSLGGNQAPGIYRQAINMRFFSIDDRLFLSEEVPYPSKQTVSMAQLENTSSKLGIPSVWSSIPERPREGEPVAPMVVVSDHINRQPVFIVDYVDCITTCSEDITLQDQTCLISSDLILDKGTLTINPGVNILLTNQAVIKLQQTARVQTDCHLAEPATIKSASGNEKSGSGLVLENQQRTAIQGLHFNDLIVGLDVVAEGDQVDIKDCQFTECSLGIWNSLSLYELTLLNCLFSKLEAGVVSAGESLHIQNCTFNDITQYAIGSTTLSLNESVFTSVEHILPFTNVQDVCRNNASWNSGTMPQHQSAIYLYENPYVVRENEMIVLDSDSPLIDAGAVSASELGLTDYSATENGTMENNSPVDLGYHAAVPGHAQTTSWGNPSESGEGDSDENNEPAEALDWTEGTYDEYYVDRAIGNDTWDGQAPTRNAQNGPKKTIQNVYNIMELDALLHVEEGDYQLNELTVEGYNVMIKPKGNVVVR